MSPTDSPRTQRPFDDYYLSTHRPLVDKIPGVQTWDAGKVSTLDRAEPPHFLVAVVRFDSRQALDEGLASPEGQTAAADTGNFATCGVTLLVTDDFVPAP